MSDGFLDVVVFILTLAVVTGLAFMIILPLSKPAVMEFETSMQDKGILNYVQDADAEVTGGNIPKPIMYSPEGVILVSQVQDPTMPSPRKMRVGANGKEINVENMYKLELLIVASELWSALPSKTGQYSIEYTYVNGGAYQITRE